MTEWHLGWQLAVPPERREVVMGRHRADIVTASGGVVEVQHSSISPDAIEEREAFYGERMAWIFDATRAAIRVSAHKTPSSKYGLCHCDPGACTKGWGPGRCRELRATPDPPARRGAVLFRWSHPRWSIAACRRLVFLDLGDGRVLRPGDSLPAGSGALYTRESVEGWLRDGMPLERSP
jgi:hypothetical protein